MAKRKKTKNLSFMDLLTDSYDEDVLKDIIYKDSTIEVIKTGSVSLDISLGIGGIPKGRITEIYGPESSAKTTLCLSIAKNCQGKTLYIDQENSLDYQYITAISGISDFENFVLIQPETGEQALQIFEYGIESGEFDLIILDSVAALAPEKEKEKDLGDSNIALTSRLMSQFLRRNSFAIRSTNTACVLVNQIRANIGSFFGGFSRTGGNALKHYDSIVIQLTQGQKIKGDSDDEIVGAYSNFVIKKNKLAPPFRSFKFPMIFGRGIDNIRDLIEFALMQGILEKRGSYITLNGEVIGHGVAKTIKTLEDSNETLDKLEKMCYNLCVDNKNIKREEVEEHAENHESQETL